MTETWELSEELYEEPAEAPRVGLLVLTACCLAALALVVYFLFRPIPRAPVRHGVEPVTPEERLHLEDVKDEALRLVLGRNFDPADQIFSELAWRLPDEPLGLRNLAICRLLALEAGQIDPQVALGTVNQLIDEHAESAAAHLLAAQLYRRLAGLAPKERSEELRLAALTFVRRAVELDPSSRDVQYAFYEAARTSPDFEERKAGREALTVAHRLDPHNAFVTLVWLQELVETRDQLVTHGLQAIRRLSAPFRDGILARRGLDMFELTERAALAALAGQWDLVERETAQLARALNEEEFMCSDRCRALPHPLEHLIHDFSRGFRQNLSSPPAPAGDLRFEPLPAQQQPPPTPGICDMAIVGAEGGAQDLLILCSGELLVFRRVRPREEWRPVGGQPVREGLNRLLTANAGGSQLLVLHGPAGAAVVRIAGDDPTKLRVEQIEQSPAFRELTEITAAALADLNEDGRLELALSSGAGISLWADPGSGVFQDISGQSALPPEPTSAHAMVACDWEGDGDTDILLLGYSEEAISWLENVGNGNFRWQMLKQCLGLVPVRSQSLALVDVHGDGSWKIITAGDQGVKMISTRLLMQGRLAIVGERTLATGPHRLLSAGDLNGDGYADILATDEQAAQILSGHPSAGAVRLPLNLATDHPICRFIDLDGDGDLDLAVATAEGVVLYANQTRRRAISPGG